uniref:Uncharacterized protein n=1 Tax=Arundo donax TaxID=35708 RepID=A0A0A8Y8B0_ARUDO
MRTQMQVQPPHARTRGLVDIPGHPRISTTVSFNFILKQQQPWLCSTCKKHHL